MAKKADKESVGPVYEVGPQLIHEVFEGFLHSSPFRTRQSPGLLKYDDNEALREEYENLSQIQKKKLEVDRPRAESRTELRRRRKEENRRREEERRLYEKRNNPQNLSECASRIQKYFRGIPVRKRYRQLLDSLREKPKKRALVIVVDDYDDRRVRGASLLREDALQLTRFLRLWGFSVDVLSSCIGTPETRPTKANISAMLAQIALSDENTMTWVHVCGVGGTASVSGKNPHRQAQKEKLLLQTPRTRLLAALASSHRKGGASSTSGDICRFLLPCDGKTARLSFDSIVSFDEILDVLDVRHGPAIFGRPTSQRLVTIDVSPFGWIEGLQGGGCAAIASTATGTQFFEYGAPNGGVEDYSPRRQGLLGHAVLECLKGSDFKLDGPKESPQPALMASALVGAVERVFSSVQISSERRGHIWGDFPVLSGEQALRIQSYVEKLYAPTQTPIPVATQQIQDEERDKGNRDRTKKKRKTTSMSRQSYSTVTLKLDVTDSLETINPYHPDFLVVLTHAIAIVAQPEPHLPPHRYHKVQFPVTGFHGPLTVILGLNGTFVDVAAKCKTKGAESGLWGELEKTLCDGLDVSLSVCCGKADEGGVAIAVSVTSQDDLVEVLKRTKQIPRILNGFECVRVQLQFDIDAILPVVCVERLHLFARGLVQLQDPGTAPQEDIDSSQSAAALIVAARRAAAHAKAAFEKFLQLSLSQIQLSTQNPVSLLAEAFPLRLSIVDVRQLVQRLNDFDDEVLEVAQERIRYSGSPILHTHAGVALCVFALTSNAESKLHQVREVSRLSWKYEFLCSIHFLIWDVNEQIKSDPRDGTQIRSQLVKLTDEVRAAAALKGFPALLIFDLVKRKTFRVRPLEPNQTPTVTVGVKVSHTAACYRSTAIGQFCDEFMKGNLNDLLPPVKGARAYGRSVRNTKYSLLAL